MKLFRLLITFLFVSVAACQYDPHAHLLTLREPKSEDLVGIYMLDKSYLPTGVEVDPGIRVEIRADGTFSAHGVPPWEIGAPESGFRASLLNGEGHWEKSSMGRVDPGNHTSWGIYLRTPDNKFMPPQITGKSASYGLIFTLGDPDGGDAILLKRQR